MTFQKLLRQVFTNIKLRHLLQLFNSLRKPCGWIYFLQFPLPFATGPFLPPGKPQDAHGSWDGPKWPAGRQLGRPAANSGPPGMDAHLSCKEFHSAWPQFVLPWRNHQPVLTLLSTAVSRAWLWPAQDSLEDAWVGSAHAVGGGLVRNASTLCLAVFLVAGITCFKESGGELWVFGRAQAEVCPSRAASVYAQTTAATPSRRSGN